MHHCDFAKKLSSDERKQIVARLRDNLDVDIEVGNPWDSVEAPDGVYRTDGWAVIPEYIGESSCLVFLLARGRYGTSQVGEHCSIF